MKKHSWKNKGKFFKLANLIFLEKLTSEFNLKVEYWFILVVEVHIYINNLNLFFLVFLVFFLVFSLFLLCLLTSFVVLLFLLFCLSTLLLVLNFCLFFFSVVLGFIAFILLLIDTFSGFIILVPLLVGVFPRVLASYVYTKNCHNLIVFNIYPSFMHHGENFKNDQILARKFVFFQKLEKGVWTPNFQEQGSKHWNGLNKLDFATTLNNICLLLDITITTWNFQN